jgi:hypothetical protein
MFTVDEEGRIVPKDNFRSLGEEEDESNSDDRRDKNDKK